MIEQKRRPELGLGKQEKIVKHRLKSSCQRGGESVSCLDDAEESVSNRE